MKMLLLTFLVLTVMIPFVSASYLDYLSKGRADSLYCGLGNCGSDANVTASSDTNASTACSASEFLQGDGTCVDYSIWSTSDHNNLTYTDILDFGFSGNCSVSNSCSSIVYEGEITINASSNCNASGSCSQGDVTYMNFDNNGKNFTVNTNTFHIDTINNRTGIGTVNPAELLTVSADGSSISSGISNSHILAVSNTLPTISVKDADNNVETFIQSEFDYGIIGTYTAHNLRFRTNDNDVVLIDTNGRLGIGTTNPNKALTVVGGINATQDINSTNRICDSSGCIEVNTDTNCNASGACSQGGVAYLNYANSGLLNATDGDFMDDVTIRDNLGVSITNGAPATALSVGEFGNSAASSNEFVYSVNTGGFQTYLSQSGAYAGAVVNNASNSGGLFIRGSGGGGMALYVEEFDGDKLLQLSAAGLITGTTVENHKFLGSIKGGTQGDTRWGDGVITVSDDGFNFNKASAGAYIAGILNNGTNTHGLLIGADGRQLTVMESPAKGTEVFFSVANDKIGIGQFADHDGLTINVSDVGEYAIEAENPVAYSYGIRVQGGGGPGVDTDIFRFEDYLGHPMLTMGGITTQDLYIEGENNTAPFMWDSSANRLRIGGTGDPARTLHVIGDGTHAAVFEDGRVGIGDDSPNAMLDVVSTSTGEGILNLRVSTFQDTDFNGIDFRHSTAANNYLQAFIRDDIQSGGATDLLFGTAAGIDNAATKMVLDSTGKLGIGTTNPNKALTVVGGINATQDINSTNRVCDSNGCIGETSGNVSGGGNNNRITKWTGASTLSNSVIYESNGKIGIGTGKVDVPLEVNTTRNGTGILISSESSTVGAGDFFGLLFSSQTMNLSYTSAIRHITTQGTPSFHNPRLAFFTQDTNTFQPPDMTEKMTILSSGNVGIGTTNPNQALTIVGTINATQDINATNRVCDSNGCIGESSVTVNGTLWNASSGNIYPSDPSWNVGIGTISPNAELTIQGNHNSYSQTFMNASGATQGGFWLTTAGALQLYMDDASSTNQIKLNAAGASFINGGNLGIGTTNPQALLHVQEPDYGDTPLFERSGRTSDNLWAATRVLATKTSSMNDGFGSAITYTIKDDAALTEDLAVIGAVRDNNDDDTGSIVFKTITNGGSSSEKVRIQYDGTVGIGTSEPVATGLEVAATADDADGHILINTSVDFARLVLRNSDGINTTGQARIIMSKDSGNEGLRFQIATSDAMTIDENSNVGIGTTSPASKLHVVGRGNITENLTVMNHLSVNTTEINDTTQVNVHGGIRLIGKILFSLGHYIEEAGKWLQQTATRFLGPVQIRDDNARLEIMGQVIGPYGYNTSSIKFGVNDSNGDFSNTTFRQIGYHDEGLRIDTTKNVGRDQIIMKDANGNTYACYVHTDGSFTCDTGAFE